MLLCAQEGSRVLSHHQAPGDRVARAASKLCYTRCSAVPTIEDYYRRLDTRDAGISGLRGASERTRNSHGGACHLSHMRAGVCLILEDGSRPLLGRSPIGYQQRGNIRGRDLDADTGNGPARQNSPGERRPTSQSHLDTVEQPGLTLKHAWRKVQTALTFMDPPLTQDVHQTTRPGNSQDQRRSGFRGSAQLFGPTA